MRSSCATCCHALGNIMQYAAHFAGLQPRLIWSMFCAPLPPSRYTATMGTCQEPMTGHPAVAGSLTVAGYTTVAASKAAIQSAI